MTACPICDRRPATAAEWNETPGGHRPDLCWGDTQCAGAAVDWRARWLAIADGSAVRQARSREAEALQRAAEAETRCAELGRMLANAPGVTEMERLRRERDEARAEAEATAIVAEQQRERAKVAEREVERLAAEAERLDAECADAHLTIADMHRAEAERTPITGATWRALTKRCEAAERAVEKARALTYAVARSAGWEATDEIGLADAVAALRVECDHYREAFEKALPDDLAQAHAEANLYLRQWTELRAALGFTEPTDADDCDGEMAQRAMLARIAGLRLAKQLAEPPLAPPLARVALPVVPKAAATCGACRHHRAEAGGQWCEKANGSEHDGWHANHDEAPPSWCPGFEARYPATTLIAPGPVTPSERITALTRRVEAIEAAARSAGWVDMGFM